jgi:uncharacterized protein YjbI with pentapeptide repeats
MSISDKDELTKTKNGLDFSVLLKPPFIAVVFIFLIVVVFYKLVGWPIQVADKIEFLKALATACGGIAVLLNVYYAARNSQALRESAFAANKSANAALQNATAALKNAEVANTKQITERFAKAIEHLGHNEIAVRLGGIYTLEQIAKESSELYYWSVIEVLSAFVREVSLSNPPMEIINPPEAMRKKSLKLRTDIQAALTVIGRFRNKELEPHNIELFDTNISGAKFKNSDLQNLHFSGAKLQQAIFEQANLNKTSFLVADLQEVVFKEVDLQEASITAANLQKAIFIEVDLHNTEMIFADLRGTYLKKAKNLELKQIKSARGNEETHLPEYLEPFKEEIIKAWDKNWGGSSPH